MSKFLLFKGLCLYPIIVRFLTWAEATPIYKVRTHLFSAFISHGFIGMTYPETHNMHATTILSLRKNGTLVMAGDGQVSFGETVIKGNAKKVRRLGDGTILAGFAGATADAFTLFERLEAKLEQYPAQLTRACVELAKDWRTDRYLRRLEAMMAVSDAETSLMLTGNGDVLEPEDGLIGLGSGGAYALAAARALIDVEGIDAEAVARKAMAIAATICVYTNENVVVETINSELGSS